MSHVEAMASPEDGNGIFNFIKKGLKKKLFSTKSELCRIERDRTYIQGTDRAWVWYIEIMNIKDRNRFSRQKMHTYINPNLFYSLNLSGL